MLYEAIADDGPLEGDVNLTVNTPDGQWPHFVERPRISVDDQHRVTLSGIGA